MRALFVAVFGCLSLQAWAQATPLDDLIEKKSGAAACFTRSYDDAHLRRHPAQRVTSITAWLRYSQAPEAKDPLLDFAFAVKRRGERDHWFSQGGCFWNPRANRDTSNNRLVAAYKRDEGGVCQQSARPDVFAAVSAEEGGNLIIGRGRDKDTLMVYLDDGLLMVRRAARDKSVNIAFGADDRVFMLRRADGEACTFLEEAMTTPETRR